MRTFSRIIAFITAAAFVVTTVFALLVTDFLQVATSRSAIGQALGNLGATVLDSAPSLAVETMRAQAEAQGVMLPPLDEAAMELAITGLVPPGWIELQADTAANALFDALETGDPGAATVELDMAPVVANLRGQPGLMAISVIMADLPACAAPADGPVDYLADTVALPACVPPNVDRAQATAEIHMLLIETLDANPALLQGAEVVSVPLFASELASASQQAPTDFVRLSRFFRLAQRWSWALWLLPVSLLLLVALLMVRGWRTLGLWWGLPLLLAGLLALPLAFMLPSFVAWWWGTAVVPPNLSLSNLTVAQLTPVLMAELAPLWRSRMMWQAAAMVAGGLLLLLAGLAARPVQPR